MHVVASLTPLVLSQREKTMHSFSGITARHFYERHFRDAFPRVIVITATFAFTIAANAAPIAVPNAAFTDPANQGSAGGGLIGSSGTTTIGSGPWHGTYNGVAGVLAPPALTIGSGHATISGLAGANVLLVVNNGGSFDQALAVPYAPLRHYVLGVEVDAGTPLDVGVLNDGNAGVALTRAGTTIATTAGASPQAVSLSLVNGTTYRLLLSYDSGVSVSGNVGVQLFSHPQNLVTGGLLTSISFGNVSLTSSAINPVAAGLGSAGGTPQGAIVNTAFAAPLVVSVFDNEGDPVSGATVTFSVPASGASAQLSGLTVLTDAAGQARVTGVANGIAGTYAVSASVSGVLATATFNLTNLAGTVGSVASSSGTPQNATVDTAFSAPLGVTVRDAGNNPVSGIGVVFSAPGTGASASFPGGASAVTDVNGHAQIPATANTVAGTYNVVAHVNGAPASASFALTNVAGPAYLALPASGTPQTTTVSTAFGTALGAKITDAYGNPSSGVSITFSAPPVGPSATFPPASATTIVNTDANGIAAVTANANALPGQYQISATGSGLATAAVFNLTNAIGPVPQGSATSGSGQGANIGAAFACTLQLKVTTDGTTPLPGVSIDFVAPASGPSATLSNGTNTGSTVSVTTDVNGRANVSATANSVPGSYAISAGVTGSSSALATYALTNFGANERIFGNGFEAVPALCP
jgi:hypothetical protein